MNYKAIIDYKSIGHRVREARQEKDLTQKDIADAAGVSREFITVFEAGYKTIALPTLCLIAQKLNVSLEYLVYGKKS
jgi:transcriptional regulator with XRE-family HTH domain